MKKHLLFLLACLFLMTGTVMAKIVKGRVIDSSDKEPIVGASIFVKSTKQGTITDIEGHFSLEIPDNVKNKLEIIPVRWIDKVWEIALERQPEPITEEPAAVPVTAEKSENASGGSVVTH